MMRSVWLFCLAFSFTLVGAQSAEQWVKWGDAAMTSGDRYGASRFYGHALEVDPGTMDVQWKCAEACRLSNQYDKAAELYDKVVHKDHRKSYPDAIRWLAEMRMSEGDHEEAAKQWRKVLQREKDPNSFASVRATNALAGCALAEEWMATPVTVTIEHLPTPVNSYDSEFAGRTGPDGGLYFSSLRGSLSKDGEVEDTASYRVRIFQSTGSGGTWSEPSVYSENVELAADQGNASWSADGRYFYFTQCVSGSTCRIMVADVVEGALSAAAPLEGLGEQHSTQPMVATFEGREVLFFVSDRPGGSGGMDIWRAELSGRSASSPTPLGSPVNTIGNETGPFFQSEEGMLYFSSDMLPGLGGYDMYTSQWENDRFSDPVNLGFPLNSPANDLYPSFDTRSGTGLFTSNRKGSLAKKGETCCNDLYRFRRGIPRADTPMVLADIDTVTVAQRRIIDLREKLPIRLYFHNDEPAPRSWDTTTTLTYAQTYHSYKALVPDYHTAHAGDPNGTRAIDEFFQDKVDFGFSQLNQFIELLQQALDDGQRIELVVRGFASPLAKSDYNRNLSLRRIQSMINYLAVVNNGALKGYLDGPAPNGGELLIVKAPFGEDRSASGVSDVLEDLTNSVYSVGASRERRIEIEQVLLAVAPRLHVDQEVIDLGELPAGQERTLTFTLINPTSSSIAITGSKADCGCTTARIGATEVEAGGRTTIEVHFNGRVPLGPFTRTVHLYTSGDPSELDLTLTGTIIE